MFYKQNDMEFANELGRKCYGRSTYWIMGDDSDGKIWKALKEYAGLTIVYANRTHGRLTARRLANLRAIFDERVVPLSCDNHSSRQIALMNLLSVVGWFSIKHFYVSTSDLKLHYDEFDMNSIMGSRATSIAERSGVAVDDCLTDKILIEMIDVLRDSDPNDDGYDQLREKAINLIADYAGSIVKQFEESHELDDIKDGVVESQAQYAEGLLAKSDKVVRESKIGWILGVVGAYNSLPTKTGAL